MGYCFMRTTKLKTDGNVASSMRHAFRVRETPNADPEKTPKNQHLGAQSFEEAMARYRSILPEKVRKNGVRCIEYLVTYTQEGLTTPEDRDKYFQAALDWLKAKHGKSLFYVGIHRDEKTHHLYAYAVPLDERGKLNCRAFLGGREKLSALQDEFYEQVGKPVGLERGIRGSRAKHQAVKRFYGKITSLEAAIAPPKRGLAESEAKYVERYLEKIAPLVEASAEAEQIRARNRQLEATMLKAKADFRARQIMTEGLTPDQIRELDASIIAMRQANKTQGQDRTQERGR